MVQVLPLSFILYTIIYMIIFQLLFLFKNMKICTTFFSPRRKILKLVKKKVQLLCYYCPPSGYWTFSCWSVIFVSALFKGNFLCWKIKGAATWKPFGLVYAFQKPQQGKKKEKRQRNWRKKNQAASKKTKGMKNQREITSRRWAWFLLFGDQKSKWSF